MHVKITTNPAGEVPGRYDEDGQDGAVPRPGPTQKFGFFHTSAAKWACTFLI